MDKTDKFWNRVASKPSENPGGTSREIIELATKLLKPEDTLLDIGCGNGAITNELAKHVKTLDAIDISSKMLELANEASGRKSVQNINYRRDRLEDLSANSGMYSVVTAFSVLHYIGDTGDFARQTYKLLKPGGYFISCTPCLGAGRSLMKGVMSILSKIRIIPPIQFLEKTALEITIEEAGFEMIEDLKISEMNEYFLVGRKI